MAGYAKSERSKRFKSVSKLPVTGPVGLFAIRGEEALVVERFETNRIELKRNESTGGSS